jgi:hypothetical protein
LLFRSARAAELIAAPIDLEKHHRDYAYRTSRTPSGATVLVATGRFNFHTVEALRR